MKNEIEPDQVVAGSSMTLERCHELMNDWHARLTPEERAEGWHWCDDWDGLLIHPNMREYDACHCNLRR